MLEYLRPWIDLYKVDLKSFDDRHYRKLGGRLAPVLDTIRRLYRLGVWVELVTLLVSGFNDTDDELRHMTDFIASVSPDISWHVTAFYADYKMADREDTTTDMLLRAAEIGRANGLRFVYAGNRPGQVDDLEHSFCPSCRTRLIERIGYHVQEYRLTTGGGYPSCGRILPGRWDPCFGGQIADSPFLPGCRNALRIHRL